MNWKESLNKAISALKGVAESDAVKSLTAKARQTASTLAQRAREGAVSAADAFVEANTDPTALKCRYLNADFSIVSPSDGIEITRPNVGTVVISDGAGNGLVVNASAEKAYVAETVGTVKRLSENTHDLGVEDGINVIVFKD
jgi:hypothetical protein